jgi:hypothetical protein
LCALISEITGIKQDILLGRIHLADVSVAQGMSWESRRVTTRVEDMAYCLLGIFNVNMPMLYGEGRMAFIRLQEEILRKTNDLSLLVWKARDDDTQNYRGVLAHALYEFDSCGDIEITKDQIHLTQDFTLTNRGLRIKTTFFVDYEMDIKERPTFMFLGCRHENDMESKTIDIKLLKVQGGLVRLHPRDLELWGADEGRSSFLADSDTNIATDIDARTSFSLSLEAERLIVMTQSCLPNYHIVTRYNHPPAFWDTTRGAFLTGGLDYFLGITRFGVIYDERAPLTVQFDNQNLDQNRQLATTDVCLVCAYSHSRQQIFYRLFSNIRSDGIPHFVENLRHKKHSPSLKFFVEKFFENDTPAHSRSNPCRSCRGRWTEPNHTPR